MIGSLLGSSIEFREKRDALDKELGIVRKKRKLRGTALREHKARKKVADRIMARGTGEREPRHGKITKSDQDRLYALFGETYIDHGGELKLVARELRVDLARLCQMVGNDERLKAIKERAENAMPEAVEARLSRQATGGGAPSAKFYWLRNRKPDVWNEVKKVDVTAKGFEAPKADEEIKQRTVLKIVGTTETDED